jgi:hypothetical protein
MSSSDEPVEAKTTEDEKQDADLKREEKKIKARLRTRGPYRKVHADW